MSIGLIIGGGAGSMFIPVNGSPDGVLTMPKGALAIDTTTGVTWRNEDGATQWFPAIIPPKTGSEFMCDFDGSVESPLTSGFVSGTGSSAQVAVANANAVGVLRLSVAAVADRSVVRSTNSSAWLLFGLGAVYGVWRIQPFNAEDGVDQFSMRFGFLDVDAGGLVTDGAYFESDRSTFGDNFWRLCTATSGGRTKVATAVAPTANNGYQRLKIRINAAGTAADFWINDVWLGQLTTNIPTGSGRETGMEAQLTKMLGSTARIVDIDYAAFAIVLTTAR